MNKWCVQFSHHSPQVLRVSSRTSIDFYFRSHILSVHSLHQKWKKKVSADVPVLKRRNRYTRYLMSQFIKLSTKCFFNMLHNSCRERRKRWLQLVIIGPSVVFTGLSAKFKMFVLSVISCFNLMCCYPQLYFDNFLLYPHFLFCFAREEAFCHNVDATWWLTHSERNFEICGVHCGHKCSLKGNATQFYQQCFHFIDFCSGNLSQMWICLLNIWPESTSLSVKCKVCSGLSLTTVDPEHSKVKNWS